MVNGLATDTKTNPSQVDDTMGDGEKARQKCKEDVNHIRFNNLIEKQFRDYMEFSDTNGKFNYCANDRQEWRGACEEKHALERAYEKAKNKLDEMNSFRFFRAGFLTGMEHEKNSPVIENTKQAHSMKLNGIVRALMGDAHIPSVKKSLRDAVLEFVVDRVHHNNGWNNLSFITDPLKEKADEEAERLYDKVSGFPVEYRQIAIDYGDALSAEAGAEKEDFYLKGIIDGMEIQQLLQGGVSR